MPEDAAANAAAPQTRVREMQTKLHRWAVADEGFRFDDVYNFVCDPATLVVAFERVAGNAGARARVPILRTTIPRGGRRRVELMCTFVLKLSPQWRDERQW